MSVAKLRHTLDSEASLVQALARLSDLSEEVTVHLGRVLLTLNGVDRLLYHLGPSIVDEVDLIAYKVEQAPQIVSNRHVGGEGCDSHCEIGFVEVVLRRVVE